MEFVQFLNHEVEIIRRPSKARRNRLVLILHSDRLLLVKTTKKTSQKQILDYLISKEKWIEKNINKLKIINEQFKLPTFTEGSNFPFLGELKYFQFTQSNLSRLYFKIVDGFLLCYLPKNSIAAEFTSEELIVRLKNYYKTEAEVFLKNRLYYWSGTTALTPKKLVFRSNQTRWGSCSSGKHISLNWKLICQPQALIDYVIVHELCHLQHFNHSINFWNLVETYLPSYKCVKKTLNQQQRLGRFLD